MEIQSYSPSTAIIQCNETGENFEISSDSLIWMRMGDFVEVGTKCNEQDIPTTHSGFIEHDKLGMLTWRIREYSNQDRKEPKVDIQNHKMIRDFTTFNTIDLIPIPPLQ